MQHLDGDLLRPGDRSIRLIASPHVFSSEVQTIELQAGLTLADMVEQACAKTAFKGRLQAWIGDEEIPRELWRRVRPKPGTAVTLQGGVPRSGGGGKNPLRFILQLAVLAASFIVPAALGLTGVWAALVAAGVGIGGTLLVNAIAPPPQPKFNRLNGNTADSPTLSIQGTRNQARPYGKLPRHFGRHRRVPDYGALPYTEIRGKDQYLRCLFDLGYGPLEIADIKIGETPIANFEGVELAIRQGFEDDPPLSLYTRDAYEEALSALVDRASGGIVKTTQPACDEISIDVTFLQGLTRFDNQGGRGPLTVDLAVDYRTVGAATWIPASEPVALAERATAVLARPRAGNVGYIHGEPVERNYKPQTRTYRISLHPVTGAIVIVSGSATIANPNRHVPVARVDVSSSASVAAVLTDERDGATVAAGWFAPTLNPDRSVAIGAGQVTPPGFSVTDNSTSAVRANLAWPVATGQYEVRLRRLSADTGDDKIFDKATWTALRSFKSKPPIAEPGHATIELAIKATNELNGVVDQLSCVATAILWDWDGIAWDLRATSSPAAAYLEALRGPSARTPLGDDRIDWAAFERWADLCRSQGWRFDAVFDFPGTRFEALKAIAAAGRASFAMNGHLYSVVADEPQSVPVQHFTPRNSWGFRARKTFVDVPHALKARFVNAGKGWVEDQRTVYADGYDESNATVFEDIDYFGFTDGDQVWKRGRYDQAVAKLRPETYELSADIEHILARRGSLVLATHDVIQVGISAGRIKSLTIDGGGNVTGFVADEALPFEAGKSYGVSIRNKRNVRLTAALVNSGAGEWSVLTLAAPLGAGNQPDAGDLFGFGELGKETGEYLVKSIRRQGEFSATLTLIDAAPAVHSADRGAIPPFDSRITLPVPPEGRPPAKPVVLAARSDEAVLVRAGDGALESRILIALAPGSGTGPRAERIEILYRRSDGQEQYHRLPSVPGDANEISVAPVEDGVAYDLWLRAVSPTEARSDWTRLLGHVVVGKSTPPPRPAGLLREASDAVILYPDPPLDHWGFVVRANPGSDRRLALARRLHDGVWTQSRFPLGALTSGTSTLLVTAIDVAGNESSEAAALVIGLGDVETDNLVRTIDLAALGWPGVVTDGSAIDGFLVADDNGELFWPRDDSALFWPVDDATPFWRATYKPLVYTATITPEPAELPASLKLVPDFEGSGWSIDYRPTGSQAPFWPADEAAAFWAEDDAIPFWPQDPGFAPWPGEIPLEWQPYEIRVATAPGSTQGQLSGLWALIDMPDIVESFEDFAIAPGGSRLPIAKRYRRIVQVPTTLQADGGTAFTVKVVDKDPLLGPLLVAYDLAGTPVSATVDVNNMRGY